MGRLLTLAASAMVLSSWSSVAVVTADNSECGLYMAVSASSDAANPKWGVYAGVPIPAESPVGPPEIAIQTHNFIGNARTTATPDSDNLAVQAVEFFEDFIWVSDSTGGSKELKDGRVVSAIPGAGALGGYNSKLTNSYWDIRGAYLKDMVGEDDSRGVPHVGRGASSHFYNITLRSSDMIPAGSEIFLHYGDAWEQDDDDDDGDNAELKKDDFIKLDKLVDQMIEFFAKYDGELTDVAKSEIYEFLVHDIVQAAAGPTKGATIRMLLPSNADQLVDIKQAGGALKYSQPSSVRDLEWLKRNGKCMDNLFMGASTIPHAGRGAFARRRIPAGGLVSPAPLIHIPDKTVMNMYELKKTLDSGKKTVFRRANDVVIGKQLLLNYCFGHPDSTMLFFPAGAVTSFINHSADKANVRMQFSDQNKEWMEVPPEGLLDDSHASFGLMMEIVALRDIEEGEEVLMDYGPEWQAAWDDHVEQWKQGVAAGEINNPWPIRALDVSHEYKTKPLPTVAEGATYPDNVRQMCFLVVKNLKEGDTSIKTWAIPKTGDVYDVDNLFDCHVLERTELDEKDEALSPLPYNYTIEWFNDDGSAHAPGSGSKVINVPHSAMVFIDKAGTSDQFIQEAFRHEIGIPDAVFPQGPWRNLVSSATAEE